MTAAPLPNLLSCGLVRFLAVNLIFSAVWTSPPVRAQEEKAVESLEEMATRFDKAIALVHQPITRLNQSYLEALNRVLESEKSAGDLDRALQVQQEIDRFGDGSRFDPAGFEKKAGDHPSVAGLKTKYLSERARLWNSAKRQRDDLVRTHREALALKEKELTRSGDLDEALAARQAIEALGTDRRLVEDPRSARTTSRLSSKIRFVAKGEVELRQNGQRLPYRNASSDREKYIDGTSADFDVSVGDVILVKMSATAVFRSFVMSIESNDGKTVIPVAQPHYRYLGSNVGAAPEIEELLRITTTPDGGAADPEMEKMWADMPIHALSREGSEWIKCGPGTEVHTYAVLILSEMLLPVPAE